jgi:hypothetical protein
MMDFDVYKRRLENTTSASEALISATKRQIQSMFSESPLFQNVKVDGKDDKGVRVSFESENERQLLFKPDDSILKGQTVKISDGTWLVTEFSPDIIYPKAIVTLCNQTLKWKSDTATYEYLVVAKGKGYKLNEIDEEVKIIDGDVLVQIKYDSITKEITETDRFIVGGRAYEVSGIDSVTNIVNDIGFLEITLNLTFTSSTDDIANKIAGETSGWVGDWQ